MKKLPPPLKGSGGGKEFVKNLNKGKELSANVKEKLRQRALNRSEEDKKKHREACFYFNQERFRKPNKIIDITTEKIIKINKTLYETSVFKKITYSPPPKGAGEGKQC